MSEGIAFLVELANQSGPTYRGADEAGACWIWTTNIDKALKFADRESAERFLQVSASIWQDACVREHEWVSPPDHVRKRILPPAMSRRTQKGFGGGME